MWVVLHSCHGAQKSSLPALNLASRMHTLLVPSMGTQGNTLGTGNPGYQGSYSLQVLSSFPQSAPKCFLQIMAIAKNFLPLEFYSPYTLLLTQAPISNCSFFGCNCRNQWAIKHTSHDANWYVLPAYKKDYSHQEKICIPKMSMMLGLAWSS